MINILTICGFAVEGAKGTSRGSSECRVPNIYLNNVFFKFKIEISTNVYVCFYKRALDRVSKMGGPLTIFFSIYLNWSTYLVNYHKMRVPYCPP